MSAQTKEINKSRVLAVEGKDEEYFFRAFIRHLSLTDIQVVPMKGKSSYRSKVEGVTKLPGFADKATGLGLVRDADNDRNAAFQSVCDALGALGLPVPASPLELERCNGCQVIVLIIAPGGRESGILEDVCLEAVESEPAMACVEQYFGCLQEELTLPSGSNLSKAKVQAYLASKPEPDRRTGIGAEKGYWRFESEAFEDVETFLGRLVSQGGAVAQH